MNERIKLLAEQAIEERLTLDEFIDALKKEPYDFYGFRRHELEKFAELIVRECADVAVKFHLAHPYSVEYQIKKHFGVEE